MFLAVHGLPPIATLLFTLVGGGLVAGASNALNCYLDRDLDGMMARTRHRPLPAHHLRPCQALAFGIVTAFFGLLILSQLVSLAAAALAGGALAYYILIYTLWLKRRTAWSTVIGSGAGAIPPFIGWAAVTHRVELTPFLLFAIISLWTMPHFWALALFRRHDYELAGLRVLSVRNAIRWIVVCSFLLVAATLLLVPAAGLGFLYLGVASFSGLVLLNLAARLRHENIFHTAQHLYSYSIAYIVILFGAMMADRLAYSYLK